MNPLLNNLLQAWSGIYREAIKNPTGETQFLAQALESVPLELLDDSMLSKLANQLVDSIVRISPQASRVDLNKRFQRAVSEFLLARETAEELQQSAPAASPQPSAPSTLPSPAAAPAPSIRPGAPPEDWRNLMNRMVEPLATPARPASLPVVAPRPVATAPPPQRSTVPPQAPTTTPARTQMPVTPVTSPPPRRIDTPISPSAAKEIAVPASPPATPQFHEAQVSPAPSWSPVSEKEQISGPAFSFWDEITENAEEKSASPVASEPITEYIFTPPPEPIEESIKDKSEPLPASPWETEAPVVSPQPASTPPPISKPEEVPNDGDDVPTTWSIRQPPQILEVQNQRRRRRAHKVEPLLSEIVTAAKSQFDVAAERSKSAFSVVSRAKEPILEFGVANLERRAREMLANEHWDDAAVIAVHLNIRRAGPDSATLACEIGDGLRLAQYDNLAVLCYTSAVVSSPPCEPACWRLCEMAISESDPILGPKWTEFIARILHAQGMDNDAITVYRQLLRLSPQRIDVAQMLSSASISNVLPD